MENIGPRVEHVTVTSPVKLSSKYLYLYPLPGYTQALSEKIYFA